MKMFALIATVFLLSLTLTDSADAQVGLYGEYNTTHIPATSSSGTIAAWYQGFAGGAYFNFLHATSILALGLDARGGYASGQGHNYRNFLIGPRLVVKPPILPLRPYIQATAGVGSIQYTGIPVITMYYSNKFQYGFIGGIDYTLIPHVDIRLAEIGYLRRTAVTSGTPAPPLNLVSIGAGVVLRLP